MLLETSSRLSLVCPFSRFWLFGLPSQYEHSITCRVQCLKPLIGCSEKMFRRGINKFFSARRCCKHSGRFSWVGCSKCRKWFHIKCVGVTKKQSEEEDFLCRPCQVVETGTPLPLTIDTLIAVTKANPAILKRVPKHARIPLASFSTKRLMA